MRFGGCEMEFKVVPLEESNDEFEDGVPLNPSIEVRFG